MKTVGPIEYRVLVIPHQYQLAALGDQLQTFNGLGAIADDIAEAVNAFDLAQTVEVGQDRFDGGEVSVEIRDEGDHGGIQW